MKLSELCSCLKDHQSCDFVEKEVCGITHDSRKVKGGYVFVAIKGHTVDGHDFIAGAIEKGAIALVVGKKIDIALRIPQFIVSNTRYALASLSCRFYGEPSSQMTVVGITGTNGKTTTSYLTKSIIEASGNKAGLIGTIQYETGKRVLPAQETTPESVEIQSYLSEMLKSGIKYAIVEASSHALSQNRLDEIRFSSAIFTNLSIEHLDYHVNIRNYRTEKLKLVKGLGTQAFAILNADHNASKHFAECTKSQVVWYGIKKEKADVTAEIIDMSADVTRFLLNSPWGKILINAKLVGKHNIYNALAAAANALALGFKIDTIKTGIESLGVVPGRLEKVDCGQDFHVYIDFAHTHQALQVVLSTLREITTGRIILVFGCGGNRDRKKRPKMGHIAEKYADLSWITSDNPRSEDPYSIISEIQKGVRKQGCFRVQADRKIAIEEAVSEAKRGDVVIIAGKGHEQYQISKDAILPFDDREIVRQILCGNMVSHM
ncbi:MAG: UDP-N-acetylmuramoyl-L-alanyl-D-glutamate--2,6-diaminopimelate ligase [Candidatus Brocadia sinica]|uniref:UDP-N-acetylmuramoyl-L-alanyl-D-glutamate--2,6-diaminopimelate ligase n=1 Tax=Candidatus Brocadia sinica JPN1 TaxID=1197129 RepID=A0ABQ0K1J5_9BACT|nr:UDP-N-acetylmuramoyl-L-alanyl-D-glutamate--2,6-diaminopimelate ligase [Candidatus Brocadia sinica]MBL1168859.1 UDP-N-acetylmuramoyl-L-alanyl-D-glutamate--2,6-diaminopimelate ligase [Candidatus Brocadia sp. AMX1]NOG42735.1 UDP-N-acetylmuramoyl-L-alanyl-D-glutamate--2,6-diaminopimelate ligase [Planctomycetota bacterium]MCK6468723.1 UDP-N-acetylmuramoyl-L-alanyl-D-glutamate--2,6-diaminopimelate ligase [Candidatus Brocadia sinica]NUO05035.1 UDP-N-acetylmuramoyl-L-alanyl-D-glutamate--2,6-diaminop